MRPRRWLLLLAMLGMTPPAAAQPLEGTAVDRVLDGAIKPALAQGKLVGGTAIVVQDGRVLTVRAYGSADHPGGRPVDPTRTLFRVGSLSKIVTAVAVMQLVEQGKLDLDVDVSRYLDFAPPARFDTPVTLRMLLAHRAGYSERLKLLYLDDPKKTPSLAAFVKTYFPDQSYAPGTTPSYSNYGVALAGYIVQRASGMSYAQYLDRNIFRPLGMIATADQPPTGLEGLMANGHDPRGKLVPFEMIAASPAGAISATPVGYVRFLQAIADGGSLDGARILGPDMVARMLSFAYPDDVEARALRQDVGLAFMLDRQAPVWTASHLGSTAGFFDFFTLYQQPNVILYYAQNSAIDIQLSRRIRDAFEAAFVPGAIKRQLPRITPDPSEARAFEGWYRATRYSAGSILSLPSLLNARRLETDGNGRIRWGGKIFERVTATGYQAQDDASKRLVLAQGGAGRRDRVIDGATSLWERLAFYDTPGFNMVLMVELCVAAFALFLIGLSALAMRQLRPGRWRSERAPWTKICLGIAALAGGTLWFSSILSSFGKNPFLMAPETDGSIRMAQITLFAGLLILAVASVELIGRRQQAPLALAAGVLLVLLLVPGAWFVLHWHILSVSLIY